MESGFAKGLERLRVLTNEKPQDEYLAQATKWTKSEWIREEPMKYRGRRRKTDLDGLVRHRDFFRGLPEVPVTRKNVFDTVDAADDDMHSLERAFLLAMVWGFRPNSYGPYRTSVMLPGARGGRSTGALPAE